MRDGWTETTLGDVAEWFSGGTPKAGKSEFYENGTIPWVVIADMMKTEIFDTASKITKAGLAEIGGRVAPKDSVLISMYATVGRPGFAHIPVATNQAIAWSVPNEKMIQPRFLLLVAQFLESEISSMARGATQRNINRAMLKEFSFNLPPLVEQKRIVDVVSSVDAYIDALQQQADTARTARNAVLHELLSAGGDDWTETTLGAHIKIVMGQAPPGKDCNKDGIGIPFVKAGEFTDGFPLVREWTTNPLRFSKLGDTLICVVGATCGKLSKGIDCAIGRSVAALQPLETLDGGFLWNFMARKVQEMRDGSRGSAQGVITKDDLADLLLRLPPVEEQKRIVEIVSSMSDVIQLTEQAVTDAKSLRSGLLSDLLSGEHEIPASYDSLLGAA